MLGPFLSARSWAPLNEMLGTLAKIWRTLGLWLNCRPVSQCKRQKLCKLPPVKASDARSYQLQPAKHSAMCLPFDSEGHFVLRGLLACWCESREIKAPLRLDSRKRERELGADHDSRPQRCESFANLSPTPRWAVARAPFFPAGGGHGRGAKQ